MNRNEWWKNLYPLRIPPGWSFVYNKLEALEPDSLNDEEPAWQFIFVQDILHIRQEHGGQKAAIDLGWYPDGDPRGEYRLIAILNDDWLHPVLEFTSRSTRKIAEVIEFWLFEYFPNSKFIDAESFRRQYPDKA